MFDHRNLKPWGWSGSKSRMVFPLDGQLVDCGQLVCFRKVQMAWMPIPPLWSPSSGECESQRRVRWFGIWRWAGTSTAAGKDGEHMWNMGSEGGRLFARFVEGNVVVCFCNQLGQIRFLWLAPELFLDSPLRWWSHYCAYPFFWCGSFRVQLQDGSLCRYSNPQNCRKVQHSLK